MSRDRYVLKASAALVLVLSCLVLAGAAKYSNGIFQGSTDIGATQPGSTIYDASTKSYHVSGGGADMWGTSDAFRMSWVKLSSDGAITADVHIADGAVPLAKAVLIFRQSLDPGSAYADAAIHADGHITLQYRKADGGVTADITAPQHGSVRLRIERRGNEFTAYAQSADGKMMKFASTTVALHDPVYVGIGVCSHNAAGLSTATFSNVKVEGR
jgi:hypothetical protein